MRPATVQSTIEPSSSDRKQNDTQIVHDKPIVFIERY
jgi:hypothetical protein